MAYDKDNYQTVTESVHDVIRQAGANSQNILFGDTDHRDNSIMAFVSKPDTMVALAESGVTHLCLEVPAPLQYLANEYSDGKIPREEFMRDMEAQFMMPHNDAAGRQERIGLIADTINNAKKVGISTHFVDKGEGTAPVTPLQTAITTGFSIYLQQNDVSVQELVDVLNKAGKESEVTQKFKGFIESYVHANAPEYAKTDIWAQYQDDFMSARIKGDEGLAQTINNIAKGEKTAIFYGAHHGLTNHQDLDNQLGSSTAKIVLQGANNQAPWDEGTIDKPDAVYDVATGKIAVNKDNAALAGMTREAPAEPSAATPEQRKPAPAMAP